MTESGIASAYRIPPGPRLPRTVQGLGFIAARAGVIQLLRRRYGSVFNIDIPFLGPTAVVCDRDLIKQVFTTPTDVLGNPDVNLGVVLGPGSLFALDGQEHRRQRKVLVPPFAGKRMKAYGPIFEEETLRESESWSTGTPLSTMEPMNRITLNVILRAVFGAEGEEFEKLHELVPAMVTLGSKLDLVGALRHDWGPWSPWARYLAYRRRFDELVSGLIAKVRADEKLAERNDVLALMVQCRYEDGSPIEDSAIADQMLTILAAGHETTATTLAWALERLSRHPAVLERLVAEVDEGKNDLLQATILEVQRTRPVIDLVARQVKSDSAEIGEWVLPRGHSVIVSIDTVHNDETVFPNAQAFDPDRFLGAAADYYAWIPFGGGTRRCIGAAFANTEMISVLGTLLRRFEVSSSYAPEEPRHDRGIAYAPGRGGQVVLHRRRTAAVLPVGVPA